MNKKKGIFFYIDQDLSDWLKNYKEKAGRNYDWTINHALRILKESDDMIDVLGKQEIKNARSK